MTVIRKVPYVEGGTTISYNISMTWYRYAFSSHNSWNALLLCLTEPKARRPSFALSGVVVKRNNDLHDPLEVMR